MTAQQPHASASDVVKIGVPVAIGAAVAIAIGVYGRLHDPTGFSVNIAGFGSPLGPKTWLTTVAFVLALVQVGSALVMYGKVRVAAPPWIGTLHRWSGRLAVLAAVPVAVHCLYALGLQTTTPRVLMHSLLGTFFFGAFVTKMLLLTRRGLPGWLLPVVGGLVFAALVGLWLTSALWVFTTIGIPA
ncbi:DUF6529 family protein [Haloechinothrix salitolerans]|uniref:DUF6529 family protein n=2 Tax=Haloechinothrix salitolerans TaxID=926830 RepID=A0ABW2BW76_9PSEU